MRIYGFLSMFLTENLPKTKKPFRKNETAFELPNLDLNQGPSD